MAEPDDIEDLRRRLAHAEAIAQTAEERLRRAMEAGRMEHWEWDPVTDRVRRAGSLSELLALTEEGGWHLARDGDALLHPDDRDRHVAMVEEARRERTGWHTEVRFIHPDTGETRWVEERASPTADPVTGAFRIVGFTWDVTERKQIEAERGSALRESEARHRLLIESWAQAVWETDAEGVVVRDSPTWRAYTGQTLEEWLGYGWLDAVHPDDRAYAERQWREAIAARGLVNAEFRLRAPGGGWRWTNVRAAPVLDEAGDIEKWAGINLDIDARKRSEALLRESEERQAFLLGLSDRLRPLGDAEAIKLAAASALGEHLGASRVAYAENIADEAFEIGPNYVDGVSEIRGRFPYLAYGGDLFAALRSGALRIQPDIANDERLSLAERHALAETDVGASLNVPLVKNGRLVAFLGVNHATAHAFSDAEIDLARDVADRTWAAVERSRAEAALREREADLARVQRIGAVGGLDIDVAHGLCGVRSPEYLRLHGLPQDQRQESHADWLARVHPDDRDQAERALFQALKGGPAYDGEYRIIRPSDGAVRWIHARADIERDAAGKAVRLVGAHIDVTEQKRATEALRESEARLAAAFESVPVGVAVIDLSGRAVLSNAEYRRFPPSGIIPSRDPKNAAFWRAWDEKGRPLDPQYWPSARALRGETVVPGQEMLFTGQDGREIWTAVATAPTRDGDGVVSVIGDIDVAKRAQQDLRESEERYRGLFESMDEAYAVVDVLKDSTGAWTDFRFVEVNPAFIAHTSMPYPVGKTATELLGRPNPRWTELYGQALDTDLAIRVEEAEPTLDRVFDLNIFPLDRERNRVAVLFTNVTERKRAEAALRESEERFQQYAKASAAGIWIRDAGALTMEFVSPAIAAIYGTETDAVLGDVERWAAMIVPEDRDKALRHLAEAREGRSVVHEFRIRRPSDGVFRWIRNTDFPLHDADGRVQRIGGIAEDVTEARLAVEHQGVLLAELQHRVRNIMAMIRSIALRSAEGATDIAEYRSSLDGRLLALARVQVLLTREANAGGLVRDIIESEVGAQAHHGGQFELVGPHIRLSPKAVEVLTLAVQELTTNALKYGALSVRDGRLRVAWTSFERRGSAWLAIDWIEEGAPGRGPPTRRGFGSDLIEGRIPYELGGVGKLAVGPGGARCRLEFPLKDGESALETDAPIPTTVAGGTLDMTDASDLTGRTVLVVEDDYYIASDTAAALKGAGARVLGPCPNVDAALDLLQSETPTHAVLDLNLGGGGPRFEIARLLKARGVPCVFLTGYDAASVPEDLANVVRLEKPIPLRNLVEAVARL